MACVPPDRTEPPRARRRDSGIVLLLSLFVVMLLFLIVPQFRFGASVERDLALNEVTELQMESLARAAILRAQAGLLMDLEEDLSAEQGEGDGLDGAAGGSGGAGGSSGVPGGAGGGGEEDAAPGNHVDSLDEAWAEGTLDFPLGDTSRFETRILVRDEDSKLNLLLLAAEEDDYREEWRQRFERALDLMRDGMHEDLSVSDAGDLLGRMERWIRGERATDQLATPPLHTGDWRSLTGQSTLAPLSLAEFALAGGITPRLLSGFEVGDDPDDLKWVPGLQDGLTVWSNLEWKDLEAEAQEKQAGTAPQNPQQARPEAQGVNNGRINVNTAPVWVLKSLFPESEIPYAAWDEYETFRREALEEIRDKRERERGGEFDREEPVDPDDKTKQYPLKTIDDLRKVDGFSPDSSSLTPERWDKLAMLLTVESNVFTIHAVVATLEPPIRYYVARSVVWRRSQGGGEPRCLPVVPFERVSSSSLDLRDFAKELRERSESYGYGDY